MQALAQGVAEWIKAFFQTAAKKGLAILLMAGATVGLSVAVVYLFRINESLRHDLKTEFQQELSEVRNEYREEIAGLKLRLSVCEDERGNLKIRLATLEASIAKVKK